MQEFIIENLEYMKASRKKVAFFVMYVYIQHIYTYAHMYTCMWNFQEMRSYSTLFSINIALWMHSLNYNPYNSYNLHNDSWVGPIFISTFTQDRTGREMLVTAPSRDCWGGAPRSSESRPLGPETLPSTPPLLARSLQYIQQPALVNARQRRASLRRMREETKEK